MNAPVTKAHREMAYETVYGGDWKHDPGSVSEYVLKGDLADQFPRMSVAAQAFANLEAKTKHTAWNEGFGSGSKRVNFAIGESAPRNPYPKLEP